MQQAAGSRACLTLFVASSCNVADDVGQGGLHSNAVIVMGMSVATIVPTGCFRRAWPYAWDQLGKFQLQLLFDCRHETSVRAPTPHNEIA